MTTAIDIVNGAAEEIGVKVSAQNLESEDYQIFFTRMNDMLSEWSDSGLTPAFVEVFNSDDIVQVDRSAVGSIKYNLAIRCAPAFQKIVTNALALSASDSLDRLYTSTDFIGDVAFPDTLPIGSGNECPDFGTNRRFFNDNKDENF